jgi:hypothetical protein
MEARRRGRYVAPSLIKRRISMTLVRSIALALLACGLSGCVATKLMTTPMRLAGSMLVVGGAVVSIAPVVGNPAKDVLRDADSAIDKAADEVDEVPL